MYKILSSQDLITFSSLLKFVLLDTFPQYFYSIKDISVGGICLCHGHADMCAHSVKDDSEFVCQCKHNTCGTKCDKCCPGFVQKKWRPAAAESSNECEGICLELRWSLVSVIFKYRKAAMRMMQYEWGDKYMY